MAALHFDDNPNDDSDFDEYNPHPYQGGYDPTLTYGHPIPPSPSTCYPLSSRSFPAPESPHRPQSPPPPPPPEPIPTVPYDHLEPVHRRPEPDPTVPYDHLESGHRRPESNWLDFDPFRSWPFGIGDDLLIGRCGCQLEEVSSWNYPKRAGDYLFGYSEGYGEKRIGMDGYGVPIYANRMGPSEAVSGRVEAARDLKVECYDNGDNVDNVSVEMIVIGYGFKF